MVQLGKMSPEIIVKKEIMGEELLRAFLVKHCRKW